MFILGLVFFFPGLFSPLHSRARRNVLVHFFSDWRSWKPFTQTSSPRCAPIVETVLLSFLSTGCQCPSAVFPFRPGLLEFSPPAIVRDAHESFSLLLSRIFFSGPTFSDLTAARFISRRFFRARLRGPTPSLIANWRRSGTPPFQPLQPLPSPKFRPP